MLFLIYTDGNFRCEYNGSVVGLQALCESFIGESVMIKYLDSNGKMQTMKFEG